MRRAAYGLSFRPTGLEYFGKTKIYKFHVSIIFHRQDYVLRFEITVDYIFTVHEFKGLQCLGSVKWHVVDDCFVHFLYLAEQGAALHVFHFEVKILVVLK